MWKWFITALILSSYSVYAQDTVGNGSTNGDLNTNMGNDNIVDSNNVSNSTSVTNNGTGPLSNPVPSAISPTVMGGGGSESCLIPKAEGMQISIFGISKGEMMQDEECNRRRDARLLGTPQNVGGLGLQISGISIMCSNARVFKAMALANTPCPLVDVVSGKLLIGKEAYLKMRSQPQTYIVGYSLDKNFWNNLLYIGRKLPDAPQETAPARSLSGQFRSSGRDNVNAGVAISSRSNKQTTNTGE